MKQVGVCLDNKDKEAVELEALATDKSKNRE